jgi:hypothetical protein
LLRNTGVYTVLESLRRHFRLEVAISRVKAKRVEGKVPLVAILVAYHFAVGQEGNDTVVRLSAFQIDSKGVGNGADAADVILLVEVFQVRAEVYAGLRCFILRRGPRSRL